MANEITATFKLDVKKGSLEEHFNGGYTKTLDGTNYWATSDELTTDPLPVSLPDPYTHDYGECWMRNILGDDSIEVGFTDEYGAIIPFALIPPGEIMRIPKLYNTSFYARTLTGTGTLLTRLFEQ